MASGHWQATASKDNRGEWGGGHNTGFPLALRAASPRGVRTAARGGRGRPQHLWGKCRQHLMCGEPRRGKGILGDPSSQEVPPDSIRNRKIPVSLRFANAKALSAGSHLVVHRLGLLLEEPLRVGSSTARAAWKRPESSTGTGMDWGGQWTSWSHWTTVPWAQSASGMTLSCTYRPGPEACNPGS